MTSVSSGMQTIDRQAGGGCMRPLSGMQTMDRLAMH